MAFDGFINSLIYKGLDLNFKKNGREGVPSGTDSIRIVRPRKLGLIFH